MKVLNDARVDLQLGLVGLFVIIGLVAVTLWFVISNAPFESKSSAETDRKLQAQLNVQLTETLKNVSVTELDLQQRISDLQDDEIQIQQWLMDNQTATHPYVPRDHKGMQQHR
jgi:ABC-type multidrug transport system fused ATPase/permease subunit